MNIWLRRGLTLFAILAIGAGIGDVMLCTNPTPPVQRERIAVVGGDQTLCDDMGGWFDAQGVCHDVDY